MDGWTERLAALLLNSASPVVVTAGETWGLPTVIDQLREQGRFGWLQITPRLRSDSTAQANALADALNEATGTRLFNLGLSSEVHLERLKRYAHELLPVTLAVTSAELAPELTAMLAGATLSGLRVLLEFSTTSDLPTNSTLIPLDVLRLSNEEALALAPSEVPTRTVLTELEAADGLRPEFLSRLNQLVSGQSTTTYARAGQEGEYHSTELVINALIRQKRLEDALELAVQASPRHVDRIVERAGPEFQRNGRLARLHLLLSTLDEPWSTLESTLEWRLVAAVDVGDHAALLPEVDSFLDVNPAPNMRARRAALLSPERRLQQANEALELARTPLTLWQAGRISTDLNSAITLLQESVRLAEDAGSPYDLARNAGSLADAYHSAGELKLALYWSQWALAVLDEAGIGDPSRRTRILNNVVMSGILTGDTLGLQDRLEEAVQTNLSSAPDAAANMKLTLATLATAENQPARARQLLLEATTNATRRLLAGTVRERVHILLAAGQTNEAVRVAEQAVAFSSGELDMIGSDALLATNMLRALEGLPDSLESLVVLSAADDLPIVTRLTAWLYTQLLPGAPEDPPAGLVRPLSELALSGLRALSAPAERFESIWRNLLGESAELHLQAFGEPMAKLNGKDLRLTGRMWEVLVVIAMHPNGISDEQLLDYLVRDSGGFGLSALRTHVSRLRGEVPVSDTPYRLLVSSQLDVLEMRRAVSQGELRTALTVLRGSLLPGSKTAGIEELRADLEAELTEAVLGSADVEVVYALAERVRDDIRLWERATQLLPATDGRLAIALARLKRLTSDYLN